MRALLVYPQFPKTFWSYEKILELVDRKVVLPPLGLITVAAILPQEWEFKVVDRNVRSVTEEEWAWADIAIMSAMIVQKQDLGSADQGACDRHRLGERLRGKHDFRTVRVVDRRLHRRVDGRHVADHGTRGAGNRKPRQRQREDPLTPAS